MVKGPRASEVADLLFDHLLIVCRAIVSPLPIMCT